MWVLWGAGALLLLAATARGAVRRWVTIGRIAWRRRGRLRRRAQADEEATPLTVAVYESSDEEPPAAGKKDD